MLGLQLDFMVLKVFSSLNDSMCQSSGAIYTGWQQPSFLRSGQGQECWYIPFFPKFLFYSKMQSHVSQYMWHAQNSTALESQCCSNGVILVQPRFHFTRSKERATPAGKFLLLPSPQLPLFCGYLSILY